MRKKSVNTLLVFGVVVAIILLMIWLFLGTTLVEDTSTEISPVPIAVSYTHLTLPTIA